MKTELLIIGPSVERHGLGGVTIHVQRLREYLDKEEFDYSFQDYKGNSQWDIICAINKAKVVHIHVSNPVYQFMLVCYCKLMRKKVIMTLHGDYGRFDQFRNLLVRGSIKLSKIPIVINAKSYTACKKINKNTKWIPAFIPPQKEERLGEGIKELLERLRIEGKVIVSTNASTLSYDKKGKEIYGIDFLVSYFCNLKDMVLVVSDPSGKYHERYSGLSSESVCFIDYPHPYFDLLKNVDMFVRNTSTDGDALSVKEAIYLGVPSLCSDVVDRPDGVHLFKYCDKDSFEDALRTKKTKEVTIENGAEAVLSVYKGLLQ